MKYAPFGPTVVLSVAGAALAAFLVLRTESTATMHRVQLSGNRFAPAAIVVRNGDSVRSIV